MVEGLAACMISFQARARCEVLYRTRSHASILKMGIAIKMARMASWRHKHRTGGVNSKRSRARTVFRLRLGLALCRGWDGLKITIVRT